MPDRASVKLRVQKIGHAKLNFSSPEVEKASNSRFEQVEVSLPKILTNLDQDIMLLGQAFDSISYTRLFNVLN